MNAALNEIRLLSLSLHGDMHLDLALHDGDGALVARVSDETAEGRAQSDGETRCSETVLDDPDNSGPFRLRLTSNADVLPTTLEKLSAVGTSLIARLLQEQQHTETLDQIIAEQKAVMDHISDGLLVMDRAAVVRHINLPAARMLKVTPNESIGKPLSAILDFDLTIGPVFRTGEGYVDRELHIRSASVDLHIMDTAIPIRDDHGTVISVVNTFREMSRVRKLSNRMAGDRARYRFSDLLGHSQSIKDTIAAGRRSARSDSNVLLSGESGTGKEVIAQSIHNDSARANGPFVAINCAALPRDLIESELFGYVAGSFTGADKAGRPGRFELASGGTIFLDEISEMPLDVQVKLLRVLQERQITRIGGASSIAIDVRVIAAANRNLKEMVARSAFREDLFYRLNVIQIDIQPLRDRREDIPRLADEFIRRNCASLHRSNMVLSPTAIAQLEAYSWPGNIRQLQNVTERLVNMVDGDRVESLPSDWLSAEPDTGGRQAPVTPSATFNLHDVERQTIAACLASMDFNIARTAKELGITRPTLYAKMKKYGIALQAGFSSKMPSV